MSLAWSPLLVSVAPPLGLLWPSVFCLGLEKSRCLGWVEGHCPWVPFSCQMRCKSGGGGPAVRSLGCSHTPLPHPLASFLELKADSWGWVVA